MTVRQLLEEPARLELGRSYVLVCARGVRSLALASELRARGVRHGVFPARWTGCAQGDAGRKYVMRAMRPEASS